jgi:hypothetical protein
VGLSLRVDACVPRLAETAAPVPTASASMRARSRPFLAFLAVDASAERCVLVRDDVAGSL